MQNLNLLIIIAVTAILIWQAILTFIFVKIKSRYDKLVQLEKQEFGRNLIADLNNRISVLEKNEQKYIQKINVLRFNPFNETGGDNSFTLSLLDANLNGLVITGLHTREKTRVYAKEVKNGKSKYELSNEEKKVIKDSK